MNKKNAFMRFVAVMAAMLMVVLLVACGAKTPAGQTEPSTESAQTPSGEAEDLQIQIGVGERGDYEEEETSSPEATKPSQSEEDPDTQPEATEPKAPEEALNETPDATGSTENLPLTFEQYLALSEAEQEKFVASFPSLRDFMDWWNAAKAQQEEEEPIILDGDVIDLGQFVDP